jgi:hypothetical protein
LKVFSELEREENYVTVAVHKTSTAEEVVHFAAAKLAPHQHGDPNYALFLKVKNTESLLRERKLAGFECILDILGPDPDAVELVLREQSQGTLGFEDDSSLVEVAHIGAAIREGVLKVRGKVAWKDRYCLLDNQCIYFSKSQKALQNEFTRIKLDTSKVRLGDEMKNGKYSFELVTPHKTYVLKGNNSEDRAKWVQSISKQSTAFLEKKAFTSLNEEIRSAERKLADADCRMVIGQEDPSRLLAKAEFV